MKSRNKVLAGEVKTLKSQMGTLVEKGKHDDELIDALMVRGSPRMSLRPTPSPSHYNTLLTQQGHPDAHAWTLAPPLHSKEDRSICGGE